MHVYWDTIHVQDITSTGEHWTWHPAGVFNTNLKRDVNATILRMGPNMKPMKGAQSSSMFHIFSSMLLEKLCYKCFPHLYWRPITTYSEMVADDNWMWYDVILDEFDVKSDVNHSFGGLVLWGLGRSWGSTRCCTESCPELLRCPHDISCHILICFGMSWCMPS